jgi:hypothetical protein
MATNIDDEHATLFAMVECLIRMREQANGSPDNEQERIDALKLTGGLIWQLVEWALPPRAAPRDDERSIRSYRIRLGSALLALGFSEARRGLHALEVGVKTPLMKPAKPIVRGPKGADAWAGRMLLLQHVHFLWGLLGKKEAAQMEVAAACTMKTVNVLADWEKAIPTPYRNGFKVKLSESKRDGETIRARLLQPDAPMTIDQFARIYIAEEVAKAALGLKAAGA